MVLKVIAIVMCGIALVFEVVLIVLRIRLAVMRRENDRLYRELEEKRERGLVNTNESI